MSNKDGPRKGKNYWVVTKYPDNYRIFDLRSNKPICFKESPISGGEGSMVLQEIDTIESNARINGKKNDIQYVAPNNVGMLLSIAQKSLESARTMYDGYLDPKKIDHQSTIPSSDNSDLLVTRSKRIYDYIEMIQSSVVFGYTAIEAFVNLSLPEAYEYRFTNNKGITELYDKKSIERWIPLKTKVSELLVGIYGSKPMKSTHLWNRFCTFEEYRNEIIHQKSVTDTDFYKKYFRDNIFGLCETPLEIIKFFHDNSPQKGNHIALWPWTVNT